MKIEEALFWLFLLVALGLLIWNLFGSPSVEIITAAIVGAMGLLWKEVLDFKSEFREFKGEMLEFKKNMEKALNNL